MKIYLPLFLIIAPVALQAYTMEDLESAIKASDESRVKEVVKNIEVTENDKKRILVLAQDMVEQRKIKYQSLFIANNSFLSLFDYSLPKIMAIVCGAGLIVYGIILDKRLKTSIVVFQYEKITTSIWGSFKKTFALYAPKFTSLALVSSAIINFGVIIKYFYDTKKQYDRAINIKQFVYRYLI